MLLPQREFFIKNGEAIRNDKFDPSIFKGRNTIYEVIRLMKGQGLFLAEHLDRLNVSLEKSKIDLEVDSLKVKTCIRKLIEINPVGDGNILFCVTKTQKSMDIMAWFVPHQYPSEDDYRDGVYIRSMRAMRKNPTAKVWNAPLRNKTSYLKETEQVFEVLLVNDDKNITECSKSNIFLIKGNKVFTTPEDQVLPGITRKKVLAICQEQNISVEEKDIPYQELIMYEAVFITGTSPKVLPVRFIDNFRFNPGNSLLIAIMRAYDELLFQDLK
jgi:branched-chain amino acid aminotransferase